MDLYPFRFQPLFRRYVWGGRRLGSSLGKEIGPEGNYAESWEIVDHGEDQSVVTHGPLQGQTLHQLLEQSGAFLFGERYTDWVSQTRPPSLQDRFPLLFKFLDCHRALSVQVHPNDEQASHLSPPDLGKTEAWVVLEAEPESKIYAGLKPGIRREDLARAVAEGQTETVLHEFRPQVGDCVFIPAGTIHALGAGLVIAEIQQASDTTYRLFDWNRVDDSGKSRPLHVEQSLEVIGEAPGPVDPVRPTSIAADCEELASCDKFVLRRWRWNSTRELPVADCFRILAVTSGEISIAGDPCERPLRRGETCLLPACLGNVAIESVAGSASFLEIFLPS